MNLDRSYPCTMYTFPLWAVTHVGHAKHSEQVSLFSDRQNAGFDLTSTCSLADVLPSEPVLHAD